MGRYFDGGPYFGGPFGALVDWGRNGASAIPVDGLSGRRDGGWRETLFDRFLATVRW